MTSGRGNSGSSTEPEDSLLQKWYCDPMSRSTATAAFAIKGKSSGQTKRVMTSSAGRPNIRWKIGSLRNGHARCRELCSPARHRNPSSPDLSRTAAGELRWCRSEHRPHECPCPPKPNGWRRRRHAGQTPDTAPLIRTPHGFAMCRAFTFVGRRQRPCGSPRSRCPAERASARDCSPPR
jgi:hypothetical protein